MPTCAENVIEMFPSVNECVPPASNLEDLTAKFMVVESKEYANGWNWHCKKCEKSVFSREAFCPTARRWIVEKIKCYGCGAEWRPQSSERREEDES